MDVLDLDIANLEAFGVDGANERATEADAAWAAGDAAVAALAELEPGAQLALALTDMSTLALSPSARIRLVGHWERQRSWTDAQAMAALANATTSRDESVTRSVVADVARTMKVSEQSVGTRLTLARHVGEGLNGSWDALNRGLFTSTHLWVLATVTRDCSPELTAAVEQEALDRAIARGWTPAKLAEAARMALMSLDPEGAEQRAREAKQQRSDVTLRTDEDQMAALIARSDAWTGRLAMNEINRRADAMRQAGDTRGLGELRIAALALALLAEPDEPDEAEDAEPASTAPAGRRPKRATGLLLITLPTLLGGDKPGYLGGYGPITASLARRIAASDIRFRRLLLDPTGKPQDLSTDSYALSAQMRRWLEVRDRTCRFPGCRARAVSCDADHAVEWPIGETSCANCGLLCRRHHNFKTRKAWRLTRNDDDSVDWHGPHGFDWHVEAATYAEFLDPPDFCAVE
jgi:hypothetical protein